MKRFIIEYANHKIKEYQNNELMKDEIKTEKVKRIKRILSYADRQLITIDEAMFSIVQEQGGY